MLLDRDDREMSVGSDQGMLQTVLDSGGQLDGSVTTVYKMRAPQANVTGPVTVRFFDGHDVAHQKHLVAIADELSTRHDISLPYIIHLAHVIGPVSKRAFMDRAGYAWADKDMYCSTRPFTLNLSQVVATGLDFG
jgi:hypothetical protein